MAEYYRVIFTIHPGNPEYAPINIGVLLPEYQARVLMATPVKKVGISVQRAHGIILDQTPEPILFDEGGNVPR